MLACKEVKIQNKTKGIIDMDFVSFIWYETALTKSSCKKKKSFGWNSQEAESVVESSYFLPHTYISANKTNSISIYQHF